MCKLLKYILLCLPFSLAANATDANKDTDFLPKNVKVNALDTAYYQEMIDKLELDQGVYGADISQHLISLGLLYQKNRKYDDSIDTFKRALHLNRINEGLYSPNQLKVIEYLIDSYSAMNNWKEVGKKYQYYFWINLRNYGEDDPRMYDAVMKLARWNLKAYSMMLDQAPGQHLLAAFKLFDHANNMAKTLFAAEDQRRVEPLQGVMVCNYFFATYRNPVEEKNISEKFDNLNINGQINYNNIKRHISASYRKGKEAHKEMVELLKANKNVAPVDTAKAMVKLGDWFLLFDRRKNAFNAYQEAYGYLMENKVDNDTIDQMFGKPIVLPQLAMLNKGIVQEEDFEEIGESQNYVLVSFDVTNYGKPRNVEILESNPADNTYMRSKILKSLRRAIIRPKMVAGTPTATENARLGFILD